MAQPHRPVPHQWNNPEAPILTIAAKALVFPSDFPSKVGYYDPSSADDHRIWWDLLYFSDYMKEMSPDVPTWDAKHCLSKFKALALKLDLSHELHTQGTNRLGKKHSYKAINQIFC